MAKVGDSDRALLAGRAEMLARDSRAGSSSGRLLWVFTSVDDKGFRG